MIWSSSALLKPPVNAIHICSIFPIRCLSSIATAKINQAYAVLGLDESASLEQIKARFAQLAKAYHPDTGGEKADPAKLTQVRSSFKLVIEARNSVSGESIVAEDVADAIEHDIKHTAPQHRQYLEFNGLGFGTPSQRQKQYQQIRVAHAVESASEFVLDKALKEAAIASGDMKALMLRNERQFFAKKHKLTGMIDRVVEDQILSSMKEGQFLNLKGAGKPLKKDFSNPYIDESEKRINDILKNNGFVPPWLLLEQDIRHGVAQMRKLLKTEYCRWRLQQSESSNTAISDRWQRIQADAADLVSKINRQISDYNLICPNMARQMMSLNFEKEFHKALDFVDSTDDGQSFMETVKADMAKQWQTQQAGNNGERIGFWRFWRDSFRR
uniref:J domain-containing protein n=1 Tax=Panagrellus redivivus TaxID=6233 RepID=A0A7E4VN57_PANRE